MVYRMVFFAVLTLACSVVAADGSKIDSLRVSVGRLKAVKDSLGTQQQRIEGALDRLTEQIDSLKARGNVRTASGPLEQALRRSLGLTLELEAVYQRIEQMQKVLRRNTAGLLAAYDAEIGRLIAGLSTASDEGTVKRLMALQAARGALLEDAGAAMPGTKPTVLAIRPDDGPDELRQKAALMADMAVRVRTELAGADLRLKRLEEERRLRTRVATFAREMSLFDESLPEGRAVATREVSAPAGGSQSEGVKDETDGIRTAVPGEGFAPAPPPPAPAVAFEAVPERETSREGAGMPPGDMGLDGLGQEIRRLRGQRQVLLAREQTYRNQVAVLQARLKQMLEEGK